MKDQGVLRAHQTFRIGQRQCQHTSFIDRFLIGFSHGPTQNTQIFHVVLGDEAVDRGHPFGNDVLMIISHHLQFIFLPSDFQTSLAVDFVEDQLDGLLVRNPPGCRRTREGCRYAEFDDIISRADLANSTGHNKHYSIQHQTQECYEPLYHYAPLNMDARATI